MNSVTIYIVQWTPESEHEEIDEYVELERPQQPVLIGSFSDLAEAVAHAEKYQRRQEKRDDFGEYRVFRVQPDMTHREISERELFRALDNRSIVSS